MATETITITDNRTGKSYTLPIEHGAIKATDLRQIKAGEEDPGLATYDPGFMNTAACKSRICYIDGDKGILEYRGYPIEQLAGTCSFLEVAYLLVHGELPKQAELDEFVRNISNHTILHENVKQFMTGFRYDAHPMGMFVSTVAALSTFYPEAKNVHDPAVRRKQLYRLMAKVPTIAAFIYRHNAGLPYAYPDNEFSYTGNFLNMLYKITESKYKVNPIMERALDILFILHADHEQNCSTTAMRSVGSANTDQYSSLAAAAAALYGPLHGGANEAVMHMLMEVGTADKAETWMLDALKAKRNIMGFGHRVYKNGDSRVPTMTDAFKKMVDVIGTAEAREYWEMSCILDRTMVREKNIYPNLDFPTGPAYYLMGFEIPIFTPIFVVSRITGWTAHVAEQLGANKLVRPLSNYTGKAQRDVAPLGDR